MVRQTTDSFCSDLLQNHPTLGILPSASPGEISLIFLVEGAINAAMSILTVVYIKSQEINARNGNETSVKSVIFPAFVRILWLSAIVNVYAALVVTFVPLNYSGSNEVLPTIMFGFMSAAQHMVIEGISFLLMQKGCGNFAQKRAGNWMLMWGGFTFCAQVISVYQVGIASDAIQIFWDLLMLLFHSSLWIVPTKYLFRRPAGIAYSRFWSIYHLVAIIVTILFSIPSTQDVAACSYLFCTVLIFAFAQPLICYWTLLQDSHWWQGLTINDPLLSFNSHANHKSADNITNGCFEDIRSPLLGADFSLQSAQTIAVIMDKMHIQAGVKMLNFACIKLDGTKFLGGGSFSKVYRGYYRKELCAIKLIYTLDVTAVEIKKIAIEASILSSIQHPNVVKIFGVSVLPPSVCLILELCAFGSLSDIIRGYGLGANPTFRKMPMNLSMTDKIFLALGCARGLAAVHAFDVTLCHRDIKSFNFLVDHRFVVKISDLEFGETSMKRKVVSKAQSFGSKISRHSYEARIGRSPTDYSVDGMEVEYKAKKSILMQLYSETNSHNPTRESSYHELLSNAVGNNESDLEISGPVPVDLDEESNEESDNLSDTVSGSKNSSYFNDPTLVIPDELLANWMAPEVSDVSCCLLVWVMNDDHQVIRNFRFVQASDVFSLSVVFWEILTGKLPFEEDSQPQIRSKIINGYRHPIPDDLNSTPLAALIGLCWSEDAVLRPTAADIVKVLEDMLQDELDLLKVIDSLDSPIPNLEKLQLHVHSDDISEEYEQHVDIGSVIPMNSVDYVNRSNDILRRLQNESYWMALGRHGGSWVAISNNYPYYILHATSPWYSLFNMISLQSKRSPSFRQKVNDLVSILNFQSQDRSRNNSTNDPTAESSSAQGTAIFHNVLQPYQQASLHDLFSAISYLSSHQLDSSNEASSIFPLLSTSKTRRMNELHHHKESSASVSNEVIKVSAHGILNMIPSNGAQTLLCSWHLYPVFNRSSYEDNSHHISSHRKVNELNSRYSIILFNHVAMG